VGREESKEVLRRAAMRCATSTGGARVGARTSGIGSDVRGMIKLSADDEVYLQTSRGADLGEFGADFHAKRLQSSRVCDRQTLNVKNPHD
jgi:hypothetical protein